MTDFMAMIMTQFSNAITFILSIKIFGTITIFHALLIGFLITLLMSIVIIGKYESRGK